MKKLKLGIWHYIQMSFLKVLEIFIYIFGYSLMGLIYVLIFGAFLSIFVIPIVLLFKLIF